MGHKGYYGQYTGNSKFSKKHDEAYDAKEAYNKDLTASARLHYLENERDDAAHIDYLKRDIKYDNKHGHSDEKMTADEKHISKLAGDMKYDKEHHGSPAKNIVGMGKKAAKAVESYKEARMQDPEEARYEEMSRKMDIKRNAAK